MAERVDGAARRREIALRATELFARKGYRDVALGEVAAAAGISRTVIYRHFKSKREAFDEGIRVHLEALAAARAEILAEDLPTPEKLLRVLRQTAAFLFAHRAFLVVLYDFALARKRAGDDMGSRIVDFTVRLRTGLAELVRAGAADGSFAADADANEAAEVFLTQFESCTLRIVLGMETDAHAVDARLAALVADLTVRRNMV